MPDNEHIMVTRAQENTHEMYHAWTGNLVRKFDGDFAVSRPYVDDDGQMLTSLGMDSADSVVKIRIWDVGSANLTNEISAGTGFGDGNIRRPDGGFWSAAVGPKGQFVAVAAGGTVSVWDTRTGIRMPRIRGKGRIEDTLAFNRHGDKVFVTTGADKFALFDIKLQNWIRDFVGPTGHVAISPDDRQIVSSGDGVVVWDVETGLPMISLSGTDSNDFVSVDWCPRNRRIAAGKNDGSVHIWSLPIRP
jgi:WD40 repeat protein